MRRRERRAALRMIVAPPPSVHTFSNLFCSDPTIGIEKRIPAVNEVIKSVSIAV